jgi:multiple sugar transport system substrate-binding protein
MSAQVRRELAGLTWDHPRGYAVLDRLTALDAASEASEGRAVTRWDRQPLVGFESRPLDEVAADYDLLIVDHPNLGDGIESGALVPLDDLVGPAFLARQHTRMMGPSFGSYTVYEAQWALPVDLATQVSVFRADLLSEPPATWEEVLSRATPATTCLPLAGPHALLAFFAICVALGADPCGADLADPEQALTALEILASLVRRIHPALLDADPIGIHEALAQCDRLTLCPLTYGYYVYARPSPVRPAFPLAFGEAPALSRGGRHGSVLGGTGVAVTRSGARASAALRAQLQRLCEADVQCRLMPDYGAQPALQAAWQGDYANDATSGAYRSTARTVDESWVRPRLPRYPAFQSSGSAALRAGLVGGIPPKRLLGELRQRYERWRASTWPDKQAGGTP